MKTNDGGPAFPLTQGNSHDGMTLRDYFAAKAMAALIAEPQWEAGGAALVSRLTKDIEAVIDCYAIGAYRLADAMLSARENGNG